MIDNASAPPLADSTDLSWHPHASILQEERVGKTFALLAAISVFRGELFVIVDDDNVLREDFLETALCLAEEFPFLGAWAGSCVPEFEIEPPEELRPWLAGLVIEKLKCPYWANLPRCTEALPPGAGMVVRRAVAERWAEVAASDPLRMLLGPGGGAPGAGDDADMALCGLALGLGAGRFPDLELTHLIPARKITLDYLVSLHYGQAYAGTILDCLYNSAVFYPGQFGPGQPRITLLGMMMLICRKPLPARRIRLAVEHAKLDATRAWLAAHRPC